MTSERQLRGDEVYGWLMQAAKSESCDAFDAHIVASAIALGLMEVQASKAASIVAACGVARDELLRLAEWFFPHAAGFFAGLDSTLTFDRPVEEQCLYELLLAGTTLDTELERALASIVARRAQRPNHLWQDLGLRDRREVSWLLGRHFEPLASRNTKNMKWKKFLYRTICAEEGFSLCAAPSCEQCDDLQVCFGEEAGEGLLPLTALSQS